MPEVKQTNSGKLGAHQSLRTRRCDSNRHYNLITHTASFVDALPNPASWPFSAPKDKVASWCEFYAGALDLNIWTETSFVDGDFDEDLKQWAVHVQRTSGEVQTLTPRHLVFTTGLLSLPKIPNSKGVDDFGGKIVHSSRYQKGDKYLGKRVVVVGSGASEHDIAQDLWEHGIEDVTMVQRSSTYIMSFQRAVPTAYAALCVCV
ncbi:MAG: NAD(P)/FAD-dependent oxidoreductase, partial [Alphaproteobacteria bacterium]